MSACGDTVLVGLFERVGSSSPRRSPHTHTVAEMRGAPAAERGHPREQANLTAPSVLFLSENKRPASRGPGPFLLSNRVPRRSGRQRRRQPRSLSATLRSLPSATLRATASRPRFAPRAEGSPQPGGRSQWARGGRRGDDRAGARRHVPAARAAIGARRRRREGPGARQMGCGGRGGRRRRGAAAGGRRSSMTAPGAGIGARGGGKRAGGAAGSGSRSAGAAAAGKPRVRRASAGPKSCRRGAAERCLPPEDAARAAGARRYK